MFEALFIAGFGGGMVRGLVGFIKHQYAYKEVKFNLPYFISMMLIAGSIGVLSAVAVKELGLDILGTPSVSPAVAFIIGYAGGDFIENVAKIILKKPEVK
ncbi:MAG: hypothetical protein HYU04_00175 [Candidatus Wildermuthbacteria bacterium]|nr:hypothetical protein [Candidatus Wildermuthbacteria bacterium]